MRNTLARTVERTGRGLHDGARTRVVLSPAPPGTGLCINGTRATIDAVSNHDHATTIQCTTGPVRMVEHLLAALVGQGIDDASVTVEGRELPALDGSAAEWVDVIEATPNGGRVIPITLRAPIEVRDGERWAVARPAEALRLTVSIDFPVIGAQRFVGERFADYANARTFGFLKDAERLRAAGLAVGADLANTVVFDASGPLAPLRYPDEPARHKCLDLLGDLALLGHRLHAEVEVHRGGHALHHALVRAILATAAS